MFSIAAINDTDSKQQWEPLAPTKEAQEFHLTQTYHQGLLKLQAKEFDEARELLESALKDPLIANAQVDNRTSDGHLLQLRLLALKNLATVFLQQGSAHYKSALHCYLQAVEIDTKDSVVWNQLGTLSCSMGLLGMSRWAFEQGLICSPNNWNCMEKLLEVLIAIGDEVACLSIAELILTRWPSHARASHVKRTIEESEPDPCAPRGIDKLEPKHVRLKFLGKRKSTDESHEDAVSCKILNRNIELRLLEVSWAAFTDALLEVLHSLHGCGSDMSSANEYWSGDIRVNIRLPSSSDIIKESKDYKETTLTSDCSSEKSYVNEREANTYEEQPHERRSTRLERLRSRKPGKEEFDSPASKELGKVIIQFLEPFMACRPESEYSACTNDQSASQHDNENAVDTERKDVCAFVIKTSKNYGVYHMGHLLLEYAAESGLLYQDTFSKLLELERLTRDWGQDRTAECSLFLGELYYDIGSLPSNSSNLPEFMSLASYHLCKIIELVALEFPFCLSQRSWIDSSSSAMSFKDNINMLIESQASFDEPSVFSKQISFWVRYFWLSGKLSLMESNKPKAQEDFYFSMSILVESERKANSPCPVYRPHVKADKLLTVNRIMHEINMLKVDVLLQKAVDEMLEKELYLDCINLLAPLLFSSETFHLAVTLSPDDYGKGQGFTCIELSAINILIKACEKTKSTHGEVYLNAHRWKLQILMSLAGLDNYKQLNQKSLLKGFSASSGVSEVNTDKDWVYLVAEEVKEISQCASQLKNLMDPSNDLVGNTFPTSIIFDIQSSLVAVMCHVAISFSRKPSLPAIANETDEKLACCFVDAGIAFCKLQHLVPSIDIKTQVELIKAVHDLLAEYGLCCAGKTNEGEEGAFLKFAIKHLLALDMKLKPIFNSSSTEMIQVDVQLSNQFPNSTSTDGTKSDVVNVDIGQKGIDEVSVTDNNIVAGVTSKCVSSSSSQNKDDQSVECGMQCSDKGKDNADIVEQLVKSDNVLDEEEKEELEMIIDNALDQCFFCLYGLNLRSDSLYEDDLSMHKNTSRGDYQTKEQCADVFQYILPYAKASSKTGLVKLRRVLRAIRKHFPQPPEDVLAENLIDTFLDDPELCEDKLSEEAGSEGYLDTITRILFSNAGSFKQHKACILASSEPYADVYFSLYYFLALSEEMSATDKWPGFVLTKEGEEFVQQNAKLFKYDLLYNPLRYESWQRLAKIYDEEVDLLLNDGSKHINVSGWRKNADLPVRVDASRRRSRRCLLMSLALAKTSDQQCEVHELLALVYYDSLQNVVPFYDQRSFLPSKDLSWKAACEKSLKHFKKAFSHKKDWSHAFYMGKLCEKLGCSCETPLSYYNEAIALNPSAVDPFYRMHASRLKLLCKFGKQDLRALKVVSEYSFSQPLKDDLLSILSELAPQQNVLDDNNDSNIWEESKEKAPDEDMNLERAWHMLYNDCLSALEICVEGDLKHFHKARYMLAQGFYKRNLQGDLEKAKEELSFSFKSYRSSFTINLWEIDGMVKKGRRKTPGLSGSKRALEVNLPESSRKFITCIRKYLMFYLKLLEETEDICTLDRAFLSLRTDKRFSLCIEDLVPVAFGRYVKALKTTMYKPRVDEFVVPEMSEHQLEKLFTLFTEHGNLWGEIFSVPELSGELSENSLYGYLHEYIDLLERNINLETLESMNEKIRKRFKNPKLSNSNCAKVCRHSSAAWCRSLIVSLALITPVQHENPTETRGLPLDGGSEYTNLLFIDLQTTEFWSSLFDDSTHMEDLVVKWSPVFTKIKSTMIRKASDENFETATRLLRSSYNFYRESSSVTLPSCVNLYLVPSHLAKAMHFQPGVSGIEQLDMSIPRKLLLWAYVLLNGHYTNISAVVKHCEENLKQSKVKKGSGTHVQSTASTPSAITLHTDGKDGNSGGKQSQTTPVKDESMQRLDSLQRPAENQKNSFLENRSSATEG